VQIDALADARTVGIRERGQNDVHADHKNADLKFWSVSRIPLAPKREVAFSRVANDEILEWASIVETPAIAKQILKQLVDELPERLKPAEFNFSLTVIDHSEWQVFTVGGGYLFITAPMLESLLADSDNGHAMLAFALAHELGHTIHMHTRRAYGFSELLEQLEKDVLNDVETERIKSILGTSFRPPESLGKFLYTPLQDDKADLFALHLCSNASIAAEAALDFLRLLILLENPEFVCDPAARLRNDGKSDCLSDYLSTHPRSVQRLARLLRELSGEPDEHDGFGMYLFDARRGEFVPADDGAGRSEQRAVVFVHGMGGRLQRYRPLIDHFFAQEGAGGIAVFGFRFPCDQSLARSGRFLQREMQRVFDSASNVDFVCHSAGGLVFRHYAEVEQGDFNRAILQGTPHKGSLLTTLRPLLDAWQFVAGIELENPVEIRSSLLNRRGQVVHDLQPDSLFLTSLSKHRAPVDRYYIFRGRAVGAKRALLLKTSFFAGKVLLKRQIRQEMRRGLLRRTSLQAARKIEMPREVTCGDLAVTLESATLEGAAFDKTTGANHIALMHDPEVMEAVVRILISPE
jgi:pimeloyl-ACP methyl ester carboxylesterase